MQKIVALGAALALAGCKLVDQTTFAPKPAAPVPAQLAALAPISGLPPLLTIRYTTPNPDFQEPLRTAIAAAEQRRPGARYDVVSVVPQERDPAQLRHDLDQARQNAVAVMQAMMRLGVADTRIGLGARADTAATVREVRVYVR